MRSIRLFPRSCIHCNSRSELALCPSCASEWEEKHLNPRKHLSKTGDEVVSCCYYHAMGGKIIRSFKYGRRFDVLPLISEVMNRAIHQFWEEPFDLVIPVPQSWRKTMVRGFHPVELISQQLGILNHIPVHSRLLKRRWMWKEKDQAGLNRTERLANLHCSFFAVGQKQWKETKNILLIDDVFTTGTTIFRCKSALKEKYRDWNIKTLVFAHG